MTHRLIALPAAALAAILGLQVAAAPATTATHVGNSVVHAADDSGYNDPVEVVCHHTYTRRWLGLGVSSGQSDKCGSNAVYRIAPKPGTMVRCLDQTQGTGWWDFYPGNTTPIGNGRGYLCYNQLQ